MPTSTTERGQSTRAVGSSHEAPVVRARHRRGVIVLGTTRGQTVFPCSKRHKSSRWRPDDEGVHRPDWLHDRAVADYPEVHPLWPDAAKSVTISVFDGRREPWLIGSSRRRR
jgi:hypothetical protein